MTKLIKKLAIGVAAVVAVTSIVSQPHLAKAYSQDSLQADIDYVRNFMRNYEAQLYVLAGPNMYGPWGFTVDTDALASLNGTINESQIDWYRSRYDSASKHLRQWRTDWKAFDDKVNRQLQDMDFEYLNENLLAKDIPAADDWLKSLKDQGYQIDEFISEWQQLKEKALDIQKNWASDPASGQQSLWNWEEQYESWTKKLEAKVTSADIDVYKAWIESLKQWIDYDYSYINKESDDIQHAASDQLPGAQEHLDFLMSYVKVLDQANDALKNHKPDVADTLLNQIESELIKPWSADAQIYVEQLEKWDQEYAAWLQETRSKIDAYKAQGYNTLDLEAAFEDAKKQVTEAKDAADGYCSTYVECGEDLNEYNGYYAAALYHDLDNLQIWWEQTFKDYDADPPHYYVGVSANPVTPTDLGDRISGPVTVTVDAPGAAKADVFVREVSSDWHGIGEPVLLGSVDTSSNWSIQWNASKKWQLAEITARAYGQPDVNYSRTSEPYVVILPAYTAVVPSTSEPVPTTSEPTD